MKKAVFLDRDGVINHDFGYVFKPKDFVLLGGVIEAVRAIKKEGFVCIVVTNQAGIARGLYSEGDYHSLNRYMLDIFRSNNLVIDGVYHCPHHPDYTGACTCRKPNPGMLFEAAKDFDISLSESYLLGDKTSDVYAGIAAGITKSFKIGDSMPGVRSFDDLFAFSSWLVETRNDV